MNDLQTLYLAMLANLWSMEDRVEMELPLLAEKASSQELKTIILDHLEDTKKQKKRIEQICANYQFDPLGGEDAAFDTLMEQTKEELGEINDKDLVDAYIIASARTVEHIEMSKYETLNEWADELEDDEAEELFKESLDEEEAAAKKLKGLATGGMFAEGINETAVEDL